MNQLNLSLINEEALVTNKLTDSARKGIENANLFNNSINNTSTLLVNVSHVDASLLKESSGEQLEAQNLSSASLTQLKKEAE